MIESTFRFCSACETFVLSSLFGASYCRECINKKVKLHRRNNPKSATTASNKWQHSNTERTNLIKTAAVAVNNKVYSGKLDKASVCELCGLNSNKLQGHHTDYSKPLEVIWLCIQCHKLKHKEEK